MDTFSDIVRAQREFFNTNQTKNISFRIEQLKKLRSILKQEEKAMAEAIYLDFKKSEFDFYSTEMAILYSDISEAIKNISCWSKKKRVKTNLVNFPAKSYILQEPLGVTLVIGAWNYPYQLSLSPAIAAIAAGNTVVLKPSELPIRTSALMEKIINSNFDSRTFHVLEGGIPETTALLELKFDKIFFTGSIPVGKIVYQAAAKNLTPVTLELGGKSPAFVTENCNIDVTVKRLVWAKFLNAGQTCIAPDYLLVHASIETIFLSKLINEIKRSEFSISNNNYVQIINEKNFERLERLIDRKKLFYGGSVDFENRIIEPTILTHVTFDDSIMKDEIFGPILPILFYENIDEMIQKVKALSKPLSLYVFSDNKVLKNKIINELSFGGGAVNDAIMHITNPNLPFGGVGDSGIGNYHGEAGFKTFSHEKSIFEKSNWFEPSIKYSPHTSSKLKWLKRLMNL
jgi:aldehyde dehydrogenase (NAD+)